MRARGVRARGGRGWWLRLARKAIVSAPPDRAQADVNAPDLYLPLMAFITYILMAGFVAGASGAFTPELLGVTASSGVVTVVLEVLALKLVFYLLQVGT